MTYKQKHNQNQHIIVDLIGYLDEVVFADKLKICQEITRLNNEIEIIEKMDTIHKDLEIETLSLIIPSEI